MTEQIIHIHRDAPAKPVPGAACNGCGVCCVVEPCPVSRLLLRPKAACPALVWRSGDDRYACGLMEKPSYYVGWLPEFLDRIVARLIRGWLAAGEGCDSDSVVSKD